MCGVGVVELTGVFIVGGGFVELTLSVSVGGGFVLVNRILSWWCVVGL